jgi:hypothetical protein
MAGREKFLATALMREAEAIQAAMKGSPEEVATEAPAPRLGSPAKRKRSA